jgi:hypothetical protein
MWSHAIAIVSIAAFFGIASVAGADDSDRKKQPGVPPTDLQDGPRSGSQNSGSTGWTGGGGGSSHMGVTQEGSPGSGQPEVAKGLDLKTGTGGPNTKARK